MVGNKIIIGKGSFGTVKLALSLIENISKPCQLICVKKSKKIEDSGENISDIMKSTIDDYFTSDLSDRIYSP